MWTFLPKPYSHLAPIVGIPFNFFILMVFLRAIGWLYNGEYTGFSEDDWNFMRAVCFTLFGFFAFINAMLYFTGMGDQDD